MRNLFVPLSILGLFISCFSLVESARLRRMVNANLTEPGEIKYVVHLELLDDVRAPKECHGGILDEYHILTVAHCVVDHVSNEFKATRLRIVAGTNDLKSSASRIERFVEKIMVPGEYNGSLREISLDFKPVEADIAVLKLKEPLNMSLTDRLEALELPQINEKNPYDDSYLEGQTLKLASFGYNQMKEKYEIEGNMLVYKGEQGSSDGKLRKADVLMYDHEECDKENLRRVSTGYICAKLVQKYPSEHRGVCKGDFGAPLVYNRKTVVGIVHTRKEICNENFGATKYTRVATFRKFVDEALKGVTDGMRVKTADENGRF